MSMSTDQTSAQKIGKTFDLWLSTHKRCRAAVPIPGSENEYYFINKGGFVRPGKPVTLQDMVHALEWVSKETTTGAVIDTTLEAAMKSEAGKAMMQAIVQKTLVGNDGKPYTEDEDGRCTSGHDISTLVIKKYHG